MAFCVSISLHLPYADRVLLSRVRRNQGTESIASWTDSAEPVLPSTRAVSGRSLYLVADEHRETCCVEEENGIFSEKLDDCHWNFPCFCELDWKKSGDVHLEHSASVEYLLPFRGGHAC